ncbi:MAG: endolytic transglycosylase MltG [Pseudomonadota bacterium]
MLRWLSILLLLTGLLVGLGYLGLDYWFRTGRMPLIDSDPRVATAGTSVRLLVAPGASLTRVATQLEQLELIDRPELFRLKVRLLGAAGRIQAGEYDVPTAATPAEILELLAQGTVVKRRLVIVEGIRTRELLQQLQGTEGLKQELPAELSLEDLPSVLGVPVGHAEGWFFPDTYQYRRGDSDRALLLRAYQRMQQALDDAWTSRDDELPYEDPYALLTMASIIEKETGQAADRPQIAQVFVRRLQQGMRLQTDPTVIYGLGDRFDGDLRRRDLEADTPYNTYTRFGLPPTPIALPGNAALEAAAHPAAGDYLYFVARGDGSSVFSRTLAEHNAAVRRYQLRRQ